MSESSERKGESWMDREYHPFRAQMRKTLFMSMAVFCNHNRPIEGYYMEFGSHTGRTMRLAWDAFNSLFDFTYVSFDSFEGLPEMPAMDRMQIWQPGSLATSEEDFVRLVVENGMPREKLVTVKGFYDRTLTPELKAELLPAKAAVIYVDCDLYSSTVPVLEWAKDFLQRGTLLVFDDWFCFYGDPDYGERRAFREFRERYPNMVFQEFVHTNEAQAFIYLGERGETLTPPEG